jgi:hypothetical protein
MPKIVCNRREARAIFCGKCAILAETIDHCGFDSIPEEVLESMFLQSVSILGIQ